MFVSYLCEPSAWLKCTILCYVSELIKTIINCIVEILKRFYYFNAWFVLPFAWNQAVFFAVSKQHIFFNYYLALNSVPRFLMHFSSSLCVYLEPCIRIKPLHFFDQIRYMSCVNPMQTRKIRIFKTKLHQFSLLSTKEEFSLVETLFKKDFYWLEFSSYLGRK